MPCRTLTEALQLQEAMAWHLQSSVITSRLVADRFAVPADIVVTVLAITTVPCALAFVPVNTARLSLNTIESCQCGYCCCCY